MGAKTYITVKSLLSPDTPQSTTFVALKEKCKSHFSKSVNELLARVKFQKRDQKEGKDLKDFIKALRIIAQDCKFGQVGEALPLDIMIRDRFVAGIRNEDTCVEDTRKQ